MSKYIVARKADEAFTEREALIEIKAVNSKHIL